MRTNEEIVSKIREMINAENEKIDELTRVLNQLDGRDEPERIDNVKRQWLIHFAVWNAMLDLEKFASVD